MFCLRIPILFFFIVTCFFASGQNTQRYIKANLSIEQQRQAITAAADTFLYTSKVVDVNNALAVIKSENAKTTDRQNQIYNLATLAYYQAAFSPYMAYGNYKRLLDFIAGDTLYTKQARDAYLVLCLYYSYTEKFDSAIDVLHAAESLSPAAEDTTTMVKIYDAYSLLYNELRVFEKSIYYSQQLIKIFPAEKRGDQLFIQEYLNEAITYASLYDNSKEQKYADSARNIVAGVMRRHGNEAALWFQACYMFLGYTDYVEGKYQHAITMFDSSMQPAYNTKSLFYDNNYFAGYLYKGVCLTKLGQYEEAKKILSALTKKMGENNFSPKQLIYQSLSTIAEAQGDFKAALAYHKLSELYADSLNLNGQKGKVFEQEQRYLEKQKEADIVKLENSNLRDRSNTHKIIFISVTIVLLLAISTLLLYLRTQKHQYQRELALATQRKAISANVHDEVNSGLAALYFKIAVRKKKAVADETRAILNEIESEARGLYEQSRNFVHNMNNEGVETTGNLSSLLHTLDVQFKTEGHIRLHLDVDEEEIDKYFTPGQHLELCRVIREAVTNTLKYSSASDLNIMMQRKGNRFYFTIKDNGRWASSEVESNGLGINSIKDRITKLNGKVSIKGDTNGTIISGHFPLKSTWLRFRVPFNGVV